MIHTLNDSDTVLISGRRAPRVALILNIVLAVATVASALIALWRPELLTGDTTTGAGAAFYAGAYATRAIPLGAAIVFLAATRRTRLLGPLLLVGAAAQLGDLVIALATVTPGMAVGSTLCAAGRLFGWWALRAPQPSQRGAV